MIDKTKAIELRKQGKQYAEISEILSYPISMARQNLKDVIVTKDMTNKQLFDYIKNFINEVKKRDIEWVKNLLQKSL